MRDLAVLIDRSGSVAYSSVLPARMMEFLRGLAEGGGFDARFFDNEAREIVTVGKSDSNALEGLGMGFNQGCGRTSLDESLKWALSAQYRDILVLSDSYVQTNFPLTPVTWVIFSDPVAPHHHEVPNHLGYIVSVVGMEFHTGQNIRKTLTHTSHDYAEELGL